MHSISMQGNEVLVALNFELMFYAWFSGQLWFSSPTRLNQRCAGNGAEVAEYHEVVNMAIESTFTLPFGGFHTPRTFLLRSVSVVLDKLPDKDWDVGREVNGWGLDKWPARSLR